MVFDHIGFNVTDFPATKAFLLRALEPLGIGITMEGEGWAMVGRQGEGNFWFGSFGGSPGPIHIAFAARNREQVRQFHAAALAAGGKDNGGPGLRPLDRAPGPLAGGPHFAGDDPLPAGPAGRDAR